LYGKGVTKISKFHTRQVSSQAIIYLISPLERFQVILRLLSVTKGARGSLLAKALIGVLITGTYIVQAFLSAKGVSYAFAELNWRLFIPIILGIALMVVLRAHLLWIREIFGKYAAERVKEALRINLFEHFFHLGPAYMEDGRTGKLQSIFIDGVEALEVFLVDYIPQVLVTAVGLVCILPYMASLDPLVGVIVFVSILISVLCPMFWDKLMNKIGHGHWESYGNLNSQFVDAMQGMTTLKAFNASDAKGNELERDANELYNHTMKKLNVSLISSAFVGFATAIGTALSVGIGAFHLSMGMLAMSSLTVILFLSTECFRPINDLNAYWHKSFLGFSAAEKMFEFLDTTITVLDKGNDRLVIPEGIRPSIDFNAVTFSYNDGTRPALKNLNLSIPSGAKIALVGQSGAGKSTVVNLLLRFFDPQTGSIKISKKEIGKYSIQDLRHQIAAVFQDTYLFYGTVEDNIRVAKPEASFDEIEACCRNSKAHDFISALPQGYQTIVGERGVRLSGGERQRISIARAMLKDAPILVLDEATSNVDASNESAIQESLDRLSRNKTTLVIAHRLSTIIDANEIYVMRNEHICEHGTAQELISRDGAFMELMKAQNAGEKME
jgi:ATP-binding cassette subfamily C protein CydD